MSEAALTLNAAIARDCAHILTRYRGRGPRKTRVFFWRPDVLLIMMEDTLTTADKSLLADGKTELVEAVRTQFQQTMETELVAAVERHTGAEVLAFMSANHIEPDLAVEVFLLTSQEHPAVALPAIG